MPFKNKTLLNDNIIELPTLKEIETERNLSENIENKGIVDIYRVKSNSKTSSLGFKPKDRFIKDENKFWEIIRCEENIQSAINQDYYLHGDSLNSKVIKIENKPTNPYCIVRTDMVLKTLEENIDIFNEKTKEWKSYKKELSDKKKMEKQLIEKDLQQWQLEQEEKKRKKLEEYLKKKNG